MAFEGQPVLEEILIRFPYLSNQRSMVSGKPVYAYEGHFNHFGRNGFDPNTSKLPSSPDSTLTELFSFYRDSPTSFGFLGPRKYDKRILEFDLSANGFSIEFDAVCRALGYDAHFKKINHGGAVIKIGDVIIPNLGTVEDAHLINEFDFDFSKNDPTLRQTIDMISGAYQTLNKPEVVYVTYTVTQQTLDLARLVSKVRIDLRQHPLSGKDCLDLISRNTAIQDAPNSENVPKIDKLQLFVNRLEKKRRVVQQ
ncbi:hypothetical protein J4218_04260 [Candidatus Pacearchaeota archaeon]|nr:hypothetical protein [Candidatus Pacearchaeota archaeon]